MVWCTHCGKNVSGMRPFDSALACDLCGRILENFNFSSDVTFVKNAAGQSQASGNIVRSVQSGISSSRARRIRIARDEFMNLRDALGIGDERDDVIDMAARFFTMAVEQNFTKGRRTELVQSSCLYLTCRGKNIPFLLIDFSSYLRVSVYELGSVYLQLCEMLYIADEKNYEKLVDPSIFIPRFSNCLLKGTNYKAVEKTARDIIASMKRDWIQTGRKPSGICGAALYTAALSHGIKCSKTDIVNIVHICKETLTKRLTEFGNTEAASLTVDELAERERVLHKQSLTAKPNSDKNGVFCMHQDCKPFGYGLCESCYKEFITFSGGLGGGSDPPAFQRAEKERMEKAAREETERGIGSLNHDEQLNSGRDPDYSSVNERENRCPEKGEGEKDDEYAEALDESDLSDLSDTEMDDYFLNPEEKRLTEISWELRNRDYLEEQAAKEAALKAGLTKPKKEKRQKRAEEAKNLPPPATAIEAVRRTFEKKSYSGLINYDVLEELFNTAFIDTTTRCRVPQDVLNLLLSNVEFHEKLMNTCILTIILHVCYFIAAKMMSDGTPAPSPTHQELSIGSTPTGNPLAGNSSNASNLHFSEPVSQSFSNMSQFCPGSEVEGDVAVENSTLFELGESSKRKSPLPTTNGNNEALHQALLDEDMEEFFLPPKKR